MKKIIKVIYHYTIPKFIRDRIRINKKLKHKQELKAKWRECNKHNNVFLNEYDELYLSNITVGNYSYGTLCLDIYNGKMEKIKIGSFCSIGKSVRFFMNEQHHTDYISSFPFAAISLSDKSLSFSKGDIIIEDDVWIGEGVKIMSGVRIGQGAIIGSGAVVVKDIPPYSICGGIPAEVKKMRFADDIIQELLKVDYNKLSIDMIKAHENELNESITSVKQLEWLPKKSYTF